MDTAPSTPLGILTPDEIERRSTVRRAEDALETDDQVAAQLGPAVPEAAEHRLCRDCDDSAAHACDGCGVPLCKEHGIPHPDSGERWCHECRLPPFCREPGCKRRMEMFSGRCRDHHPLWASRFDAKAQS